MKLAKGKVAFPVDMKPDAIYIGFGGVGFVMRLVCAIDDEFARTIGVDSIRGAASARSIDKIHEFATAVPVFGHIAAGGMIVRKKVTELRFHVFMIAWENGEVNMREKIFWRTC